MRCIFYNESRLSELSEGVKALFRPITVIVPDFLYDKKIIILYGLCQDLLRKQMYLDWGLHAIKSVFAIAGVFEMANRDITELLSLKRVLRDYLQLIKIPII